MNKAIRFIVLIGGILMFSSVLSQESLGEKTVRADSLKNTLVVLPLAFYAPETRLGFGLGGAYTFFLRGQNPEFRPSQVQLGLIYTLEKQILIYFPYELYAMSDKLYLSGEVGFYKYIYRYYGLGSDTRAADEEFYSVNFPRLIVRGQYLFLKNLYAGVSLQYDNYFDMEIEEGGLLSGDEVVGKQGGQVLRYGLTATYDIRDNVFWPTRGVLFKTNLERSSEGLLSEYSYSKLTLDVAGYRELWGEHILAGNVFYNGRYGEAPFFDLAQLGGPKKLRGYFEGRFRGDQSFGMQAEYRMPVFWRFFLVGFGGNGVVWDRRVEESVWQWSYGAGLRFRVDKGNKVNIRVDYAWGKDSNGLYVTIGEAF